MRRGIWKEGREGNKREIRKKGEKKTMDERHEKWKGRRKRTARREWGSGRASQGCHVVVLFPSKARGFALKKVFKILKNLNHL